MGYFWQNLLILQLPAKFRHPFVSIPQSIVAPVAAVDDETVDGILLSHSSISSAVVRLLCGVLYVSMSIGPHSIRVGPFHVELFQPHCVRLDQKYHSRQL